MMAHDNRQIFTYPEDQKNKNEKHVEVDIAWLCTDCYLAQTTRAASSDSSSCSCIVLLTPDTDAVPVHETQMARGLGSRNEIVRS